MVWRIARKEMLEMRRDGRFRAAAAIVLALLVGALGMGSLRYQEVSAAHEAAHGREREIWESQGEKNPHGAAHYGVYAFKPTGPLSFVEPGAEAYTGVTVWLEAHKQNQAIYRPARDGNTLQRFGELTAASVMQLLVPLLIILLGFAAFSGEREEGTLPLLMSLGVNRRSLALGKAAGVGLGLAALLVPAAAIGGLALTVSQAAPGEDLVPRAALLAAAYLLYFGVFAGVSLGVSAAAPSSRVAFVSLLGFWILTSLAAPRAMTDAASHVHPIPSGHEFALALQHEMEASMQGAEYREFVEAKTQELLLEHGVETVEQLPVNFSGFRLNLGEDWADRFFDKHYGGLWDRFEAQDRLYQATAAVSPLLAVRSLSMAMAGTDFAHFRHFTQAAENYRRDFIRFLNDDLMLNSKAGDAYLGDAALWSRMPRFEYEPPSTGWALEGQGAAASALVAWFAVAAMFAFLAASRMRAFR